MKRASDVSAVDGSIDGGAAALPGDVGAEAPDNGNAPADAILTAGDATADPAAGFDGLTAGDNLVHALLQMGEGTTIDPAGHETAMSADAGVDLGNVAVAIDDLGGMLDMLAPRLDALIAEVNLFDIDVPGDSFGDA